MLDLGDASFMLVFPAPAGMNRSSTKRLPNSASVPRTRGDEPRLEAEMREVWSVFPAPAGMNRCH